jgi:FkbM family methyltransferase
VRVLDAFADAYPRAFFVEIGANDGLQHDHLRRHIEARAWTGIMVEPVPYVFERLQGNYGGNDRVALENVAIADRDGELPFFHLAEAHGADRDRLPGWYDGIGSFSREVVLDHAPEIPDIEARLVEDRVPALRLSSLLAKHGVDHVDLLALDTEGHDWEIIRTIDLAATRPRLVLYEHYHLPREARERCRRHLADAGYATLEEGFDTLALDTAQDDALTRAWRPISPAVPGVAADDERP